MMRDLGRVMVTGGAGFIGSAFIRRLFSGAGGASFQSLLNVDALTYAADLENLGDVILSDERYAFLKGDISDARFVGQVFQKGPFDTIVNFAAESHVDRSISSAAPFMQSNMIGVFNLLEEVRKYPEVYFHQISTDEVYGTLTEEGLFSESSPYLPNSPYSASKASADHLVRAYGKTYDLNVTISICSNNYGPCQYPEKFIPVIIKSCLDSRSIPVYGRGENIRDWIYVDDHVDGVLRVLQNGRFGEVYNLGGNNELKNIDLVHQVIAEVARQKGIETRDLEMLIKFVTDRPGHDFRYGVDHRKATQELGWQPTVPFSRGLTETVAWYLDKGRR